MEQKDADKRYAKKVPWWLLALKFAWNWANGKRKDTALLKKAVAASVAATAGTVVVGAGVVGYSHLEARVDDVEARPVLDLGPVRATTRDLAKRVDDLHSDTTAMLKRIQQQSAGQAGSLKAVTADATELAEQVRTASVDIASLSGQVRATADAASGSDKGLADQMAELAETTAQAADALSGQIANLEARLAAAEKANEKQTAALAEVSSALADVSTGLDGLRLQVAKIDSQLTDLDARIADVGARANSAQKTADDALAAVDQVPDLWYGSGTTGADSTVTLAYPEYVEPPVVACTAEGQAPGNNQSFTAEIVSITVAAVRVRGQHFYARNQHNLSGLKIHCLAMGER